MTAQIGSFLGFRLTLDVSIKAAAASNHPNAFLNYTHFNKVTAPSGYRPINLLCWIRRICCQSDISEPEVGGTRVSIASAAADAPLPIGSRLIALSKKYKL